MLTLLSGQTEELQRFRANPWPFQQTFETPLKDLSRFVSTFLAPFSVEKGALSTDEVVFELKNLLQLLSNYSVQIDNAYRFTIEATGKRDIADLLQSTLGDWVVDFAFVLSPEQVAIYADHDQYTTFYTSAKATLKNLASTLESAGFKAVLEYTRGHSGDRWR